jgi:lipopolysaccharide biosynthesis glycosyltransferase
MLLRSWPGHGRYQVHWVSIDATHLEGIDAVGHVTVATYYRILIPLLLPASVRRVIYIDSDVVCTTDIRRLWEVDLGDAPCGAVQELGAPFLDASVGLPNFERCRAHLVAVHPVPNFRELGLNPKWPYFNAGVLLLNVERWRQENISRKLLDCLRENKNSVLWWDQYALNIVLANRWFPLDCRWNQSSFIYTFPAWRDSPLDRQTFRRLKHDPYIIHFNSIVKPWHAECRHPHQRAWFRYLDRTEWRGWRPPGTPSHDRGLKQECRDALHHLRDAVRSRVARFRGWLHRSRPAK